MNNTHTFFKRKARWLVLLSIVSLLWVAPKEAKALAYDPTWIKNLNINFAQGTISMDMRTSHKVNGENIYICDSIAIYIQEISTTQPVITLKPHKWDGTGGNYYRDHMGRNYPYSNAYLQYYTYSPSGTWNANNFDYNANITFRIQQALLDVIQSRNLSQLTFNFIVRYGNRTSADCNSSTNPTCLVLNANYTPVNGKTISFNNGDSYPKTPTLTSITPVNGTCKKYQISASTGSGDNETGTLYLCKTNGTTTTDVTFENVTSETSNYTLNFIIPNLGEEGYTYYLERRVTRGATSSKIKSTSTKLLRYTQPDTLIVRTEHCSKGIKLSWTMPAYNSSNHNSSEMFAIYRSKNGGAYTQVGSSISFQTGVTNYEYIDANVTEGEQYRYRIKRHPWDITCTGGYAQSNFITTNFSHVSPPKPTASKQANGNILVSWTNSSSMCDNTKIKLIVQNLSSGTELTKNIKDGDTLYTMTSVQLCTKYAFVVVYATDKYGDLEGPQSNTIIISDTLKIGNKLEASKGYYTDKITLQWESTTPALIDDWEVMRRDLPNGSYSQVSRFANNNSSTINFEDLNAQSGIMYQYKVTGISNCADTIFRTPEIKSIGFRQPLGMVMGSISYGTSGEAVRDVVVVAEVEEGSPYINNGKSMSFNGTSSYMKVSSDTSFTSNKAFSIQCWIKPQGSVANKTILAKGGEFELKFNANSKLCFTVGNQTLTLDNVTISQNEFTHISAIFNKNAANNNMLIYINGYLADSLSQANISVSGNAIMYVGAKTSSNGFFNGYIDDLRIWKKSLTAAEIEYNHSTVLAGKESDLGLYIRGEESANNLDTINNKIEGEAYDISYISSTNKYNANLAKTYNVIFASDSSSIPTKQQLGYKGKTDANGFYTIAAIPYAGNGTTYKITPMLGVHSFRPSSDYVYIGVGNIVYNKIDFEDISSFTVKGFIHYEGTNVGVNDVMFAVDGNTCVKEGKIITSHFDQGKGDGYYEIQVPIGFHSITASKHGHTFYADYDNEKFLNSRFPGDSLQQYNFQNNMDLNFIDVTKVELIGRFVGGPVEAAKPIGFGISNNNIGVATINLELQKSGHINIGANLSETDTSSNGTIITYNIVDEKPTANGNRIIVSVKTDSVTGEFVAYLFPENYQVEVAGTKRIIKVDNALQGTYEKEYAGIISMKVDRETVYLYDTDTMTVKPNSNSQNQYQQDTMQGTVIDSTTYHNMMDVIYRVNPSIEVVDYERQDTIFGERQYIVSNPKTGEILDTLNLINNNNYVLQHPIFIQQRSYAMEVSVFERYENQDKSLSDPTREDRVPTVDGKLIVTNSMAAIDRSKIDTSEIKAASDLLASGEVLSLNKQGKAIYSFITGAPNITTDANHPENNYLKTLNFKVEFSDGTPTQKWRENDRSTYVLGAYSDGNNFVTRGPRIIDFILRDPPGSNSYAWLEEGSELETTHEWGGRFENETGLNTELKFGMEMTTWVGLGAGTATTVGAKNTTNVGLKTTNGGGQDNTFSSTYTFNQRIQTSPDPLYTGTFGDIFIGSSYNIIFGESRMIDIFDNTIASDPTQQITGNSGRIYKIGNQSGITLTPEFETHFMLTHHEIVFEAIPNFELIRNSLFTHYPDSINPPPTTGSNNGVTYYISHLPKDHPDFGKDTTTYTVIYPQGWETQTNKVFADSVKFYNLEIAAWKKLLAQNEQEKIESEKLKNLSFDAGVIYDETHTRDTTNAYTLVYEGCLNVDGNTQFGTDVAGVGVEFTVVFNNKGSWFNKNSESEKKTTSYGFHLEDGDNSDYLTVDILEPKNNSTAFRVLGGQSSCPYQDEEYAQYFEPERGHVLHQATAQVEAPYLEINPSTRTDVPGNQAAYFTLTVGNNSLVESAWYKLVVDESTNPDGLEIKIDGQSLASGRVFLLEPTSSYAKTLTVKKTRPDINTYKDIRLILHSQCQYDPTNNRDDIYDEIYISVEFLPTCTDLTINTPFENQIINSYTGDEVQFQVSEFDVDYQGFSHIILEYKSATENSYTPIAYYYKDQNAYDADTDIDDPNLKNLLGTQPVINHQWITPNLDGKYNVRARSVCPAGAVTKHEAITEPINIIKDMLPPIPFGSPQPADGILSRGDDILITFNEDILANQAYRISIQGELNGEELLHNSGLFFDGDNDMMEVTQSMNLAGKSFTVEFWTIREGIAKNAVLFSHGTVNDKFEIGLDSQDKLLLTINDTTITSFSAITDLDKSWTHIAVVYDANLRIISAYVNGNVNALINSIYVGEYLSTGIISVASDFEKTKHYNGRMNELRIWTKALSASTLYTQMNTKLSGTEIGLMGYWPMNEARGNFVNETVRGRNATTNATWFALPEGRSLELNGSNQYAKTSIFPEYSSTSDFSVEFWFRADENNANACLFSTGRGDNSDYNPSNNKFSIYFDENKDLTLRSANKTVLIASDLADNDWHHFAISINRRGNANIYVDFELQKAIHAADYFGMFSGVNLWLGAMGWETNNSGGTNVTNFFKGNIDELRIWKSALTRDGIKIAATSRLKGNEIGLRAYYPFERVVSTTDIRGTADDYLLADTTGFERITPNSAFTLHGGADYSSTAANIKPARTLKNVDFEKVFNNNQIYFPLLESMKKIENCILEITVSDVQDMHGNRLESPVKWTAYIDQNYLKWSEEKFVFIKNEFEPLSFKANAINRSGAEQAYTIDNLPAWLTASPSSGVISPTGTVEITFTVNTGLNIGIYDENIYLINSDGLAEILSLDLRVIGEEPDWDVDPTAYDYSMSIFGELNVNGIISTDEEDILAAFVGSTCVGVTKLTYVAEYDRYLAFLNVYGNTSNTPLEFKIWDASTGLIFTKVSPDTLVFRENSYYGTAKSPITFRALNYIEQVIPLKKGWNWISKNVTTPSMTTVNAALENNTFVTGDLLKSQFNGFDQYTSGGWAGSISNSGGILNTQMYMLKVQNDKKITIVGEPVNTAEEEITIYPGWTWIGFTPQINLSVTEALVGANPQDGDLIKSQNAFSIYNEGLNWIGTLNYLMPGNGYIYYSTSQNETVFSYPNISSLSNNTKSINSGEIVAQIDTDNSIERNNYQHNLSIVATLESDEIMPYDATILCYVGNECRGVGNIVYVDNMDKYLYFITVGGDIEGESLSFRLKTETGKVFALKERLKYKNNQLYGSIENPVVFTLGTPDGFTLNAYPVPFTTELTIEYTLNDEEKGLIEFSIMDATGRVLSYFDMLHTESGFYSLSLNEKVNTLASGVYFITMKTQIGKQVVKVVKTK